MYSIKLVWNGVGEFLPIHFCVLHFLDDVSDCGQESEESADFDLVRVLIPEPHVFEHELHDSQEFQAQFADRLPSYYSITY